ncbi:MAG: GTPase HflX [Lachnospiraceae bacterium]|jgi:GTP-binding protein HflX|nr:GTPase HflX [Lachnospiraceae bacterium]MCI9013425.1 GTPase HflX [Lachnospiraceae bacterium]
MEKAFLVGVNLNDGEDYLLSLEELDALAQACDMEVVGIAEQTLPEVHKAYYIGTGKVDEVKEMAMDCGADVIIFDNSLSPMQLRNLQERLEKPVLDRSTLILDIFAGRARSREAKLQVEVARLQYMLPRLVGLHAALGRQGGGTGSLSNKGAGEKKLELDRRVLERRLTQLRRELKEVGEERQTQRKRRAGSGMPRVALVGYTNAGKSTLLNAMLDLYGSDETDVEEKKVMEKDMLFATLDTTVRKIAPDNHHAFLLSDTVGFIHKLPHNLVEAFHSTLEEAKEASLLLQVVDYSDPHYKEQIAVTNQTLRELGADGIPMIYVYNKADLVSPDKIPGMAGAEPEQVTAALPQVTENSIYLSAKERIGMEELIGLIEKKLAGGYLECTLLVPYTDGRVVSYLNENGVVSRTEYLEEGVKMWVNCRMEDYYFYQKYHVESDG